MLVKKLTALIVVASAITVVGCNDTNNPQGTPIITTPTQPPAPPAPVPVVTVGSFATDQVKTLTCFNNNSVSINGTMFTDSEAAVDVEALIPGCMGGPAS